MGNICAHAVGAAPPPVALQQGHRKTSCSFACGDPTDRARGEIDPARGPDAEQVGGEECATGKKCGGKGQANPEKCDQGTGSDEGQPEEVTDPEQRIHTSLPKCVLIVEVIVPAGSDRPQPGIAQATCGLFTSTLVASVQSA